MLNNVRDTYKYLHKHPELSYHEIMTTAFILNFLSEFGDKIEVTKLDPTGVIAVINNNSNETIGFRTDIDALPINEKNDFEYSSLNDGVMHACGHDGHTTILLHFIKNIFDKNIRFTKNLMFIFQPAEEVDGGANVVLNSEVFKSHNIKHLFGIHLWPELDKSVVGLKSKNLMGTNYVFELKIFGKSSHASTPQFSVDSTQVLGELIQNINFLIAKTSSPFEPVVINIGKINGGVAPNVIIDEIVVNGTMRASNDDSLLKLVNNFKVVVKALEEKYGCEISLEQTEVTYPSVYNDVDLIKKVETNLEGFKTQKLEFPSLACEDFGFYSQKLSTAFFFLGTKDSTHTSTLHSPTFAFDLEVLDTGVSLYEQLLHIFG